jgi:hypothetical protein
MNYQYTIGLFANDTGYAMSLIQVDENQNYKVIREKYNLKKVSIKEITSNIELLKEYDAKSVYLNELPSLVSRIKNINAYYLELNVEDGIFIVNGLRNDEQLIIEDENLKYQLNKFDKEIINHRCYALFFGLQAFKYRVIKRRPVMSFSVGG